MLPYIRLVHCARLCEQMNETFLAVFVSRPASRLLGYSGTDSIADAFPASTQFEPPLLCDQLEAVIQALLEPFCLWRFGVTHRRKPLLQTHEQQPLVTVP